MSTPTPPSTAAAPTRSWPLRIAGFLAGAALLALGTLVVIGYTINSFQPGGLNPDVVFAIVLAIIVLLGVLAWKRVRILGTWLRVAVGAVVAVAGLAWLAKDDAAYTHPLTLEELSGNTGPEGAAGYDLTMRYTERDGRAGEKFVDGKIFVHDSPVEKPAAWLAAIQKSRTEIIAEWDRIVPEREWFAAMEARPVLGDDTSAGFNAPVMRFAPFRRVTSMGGARAGLLALEGKGDEAMDIVLRQLAVCSKLEKNSRTLVRSMVALTGWRDGLGVAKFILSQTPVSPEKRAALAAVVGSREEHDRVLRRLVWVDFVNIRVAVLERGDMMHGLLRSEMGSFGTFTAAVRPLVLLPNHTANLSSGFLAKVEEAARRRDKAALENLDMEWYRIFHRDGPKNFGGKYMMALAMPSLGRAIDRSWAIEDLRKELLAQLAS